MFETVWKPTAEYKFVLQFNTEVLRFGPCPYSS